MLDWDKWQELFSTLHRNKLRTLMTVCGVFWGIFMLVLMLGFGNGLKLGVSNNMLGFVSNSVYVWGQRTSMAYKGLQPGRWIHFDNADTEAISRKVPGIRSLAPRIQLGGWRDGNSVTSTNKAGNFGVIGDHPEVMSVERIQARQGRFLNELDLQRRRKVTVIGDQVRRVLFGTEDPIGKFVQIRGIPFQVVGVVRSDASGEQGDRANSTLHIPLTTFQAIFKAGVDIGWFGIQADPDMPAEQLEKAVRQVLAAQHNVHPEDHNALGSYNAGKSYTKVENLFAGVRFFVWFVALVTLLAGVLGVSNIMLISVKERTKEIGIRKAIGATPYSIVSQVVQEAAFLTALSGYAGLVVGVITLEVVGSVLAEQKGPLGQPTIDFQSALLATAVLLITGVIAGLAPAHQAAKIRPVEALRTE